MNRLALSICLLSCAAFLFGVGTSETTLVSASPQDSPPDSCPCGDACECDPCLCLDDSKAQHASLLPVADSTDPVTGLTANQPTVYMLTTNGCPPCERWRREVQPWVESTGQWQVTDVYGYQARRFPTFRIWTGKRWIGHEGFMPKQTFKRLLGGR